MMVKIRQKVGSAMIFVLVLAFGGLWMLQDSGVFDAAGAAGAGRTIAVVDGQDVSAELYDQAVEQRVQLYEQQGVEVTESVRAQIENEVFEALVDNALREKEMERLGIEVSDAEVVALITGDNPDPIIRQLFPDGQGGVDRTRLRELVDQSSEDPQLRSQLVALQEQIRQGRRQAKLDAMVSASVRVTDAEVEREFIRRNRRANVRYVALRYADVADSEVEVSEADLKAYYRDHADDYEREATSTVEYVSFPKTPTRADSNKATTELRALRSDLAAASDAGAFAAQHTFGAVTAPEYTPAAELAPGLADAIYSDLKVGRVVGPLVANGEAVLAKITGVRDADDPIVHARHILLPQGQREQAQQLKARIEAGELTFEAAARQFSTDESNKALGGELGWFGRGRMVRPFEEAAFSAPVGQIVGPVETQFGFHLLKVIGKSNQEAQIVRISRVVQGDYTAIRDRAEDFQVFTEEEGRPFNEAAADAEMTTTSVLVTEDQTSVPNLQVGRPFFRFVRSAKVGDLSEPIDAGDQIIVAHLAESIPAGTRPFEEVKTQIEAEVMIEKKRAVQAERLRAAATSGATLNAIAQNARVAIQEAEGLSLSTPTVPGFGREPSLVGAAFGLKPGQRTGVIEGENAAFVVQTSSLRGGTPGELTAEARDQIRQQVLQRKRARVQQAWIQGLREGAKIEDFRSRFL